MKHDRPSSTARLVTEGLMLVAHEPAMAEMVPAEALKLSKTFARSWGRSPLFFRLLSSPIFRRVLFTLERMIIPGIALHYAVRKKHIEATAISALGDGAQQVVVLGAGFDTLALRLSAQDIRIQWIEIDHPATQAVKLEALQVGHSYSENLHFHAADLSNCDPVEVLRQAHCDPHLPTLYIAEGLLMYFAPQRAAHLLRTIANYTPAGSSFVFSCMEKHLGGRIGFRSLTSLVNLWLRLKGEPFTWGMEQSQMSGFLSPLGWTLTDVADEQVLRQRYLDDPQLSALPLAQGEIFYGAWKSPTLY